MLENLTERNRGLVAASVAIIAAAIALNVALAVFDPFGSGATAQASGSAPVVEAAKTEEGGAAEDEETEDVDQAAQEDAGTAQEEAAAPSETVEEYAATVEDDDGSGAAEPEMRIISADDVPVPTYLPADIDQKLFKQAVANALSANGETYVQVDLVSSGYNSDGSVWIRYGGLGATGYTAYASVTASASGCSVTRE